MFSSGIKIDIANMAAPSCSDMPPAKKKQKKEENRIFNEKWKLEFFFILPDGLNAKPMCLICNKTIANIRKHDIQRHYNTHKSFHERYPEGSNDRKNKLAALLKSYETSSNILVSSATGQEKATEVSMRVSWILNKHKQPFTTSEIVKSCLIESAKILCPNAVESFKNVPLSNDTNTRRSELLAGDVKDKVISALRMTTGPISLAADESTDITDMAQLSLFVRYLDKDFCIFREELLAVIPLTGSTTGHDIYTAIKTFFDKNEIPLGKISSFVTDGAPAMVGRQRGAASLLKKDCPRMLTFHCIIHNAILCCKLKNGEFENPMNRLIRLVNFLRAKSAKQHRELRAFLIEHEADYYDVPLHTAVRWLSKGEVLNRMWNLRQHISAYLSKIDNDIAKQHLEFLQDENQMTVIAFLVDIFGHLNELNLKLQGRYTSLADVKTEVTSFQAKLGIFKEDLRGEQDYFENFREFAPNAPVDPFVQFIEELMVEFQERFSDFSSIDNLLVMVKNPFAVDAQGMWLQQAATVCPELPKTKLQMQFVNLTADDELKLTFNKDYVTNFWIILNGSAFPELKTLALTVCGMFGTTYICEQSFSQMNIIKTKNRSTITNAHLQDVLRIATTTYEPDFRAIANSKKCNFSH